jgi:RNA polymerase sigma-70 factor (ECF subfamily)
LIKELATVISQKEKEILALLKRDNPSGLKILFEEYHGSLCLLANRMVADRDISKDIVQEVFIKLWGHRQKLDIAYSLSAYLKRSVINTALNYLEKDKRSSKVGLEQIGDQPHVNFSDQKLSFDELSTQIDKAINNLPVRTRSVFILIRKEEMSYNEASTALGISIKAVEKEMMKALKLMREMLKNYLPAIFIASTII